MKGMFIGAISVKATWVPPCSDLDLTGEEEAFVPFSLPLQFLLLPPTLISKVPWSPHISNCLVDMTTLTFHKYLKLSVFKINCYSPLPPIIFPILSPKFD